MVELSNNEASSLVKLAVRGVGYPWGLGEEAVHVAKWLVERELPALELFRFLLVWADKGAFSELVLQQAELPWCCYRDELCPLICGSAIIDSVNILHSVDCLELKKVVCPILLLPFVSEASAELGQAVRVSWADQEFVIHGNRVESAGKSLEPMSTVVPSTSPETVFINIVKEEANKLGINTGSELDSSDAMRSVVWSNTAKSRTHVELACLETLKQYAHRTYAPATELSRLSGAGAGTSDND